MTHSLYAIASSTSDSFSLGFKIGVVLGVPIAAWVAYKLCKKLNLF